MHPDDHQNISNKTFVQAILNNPFFKNNLKKKNPFDSFLVLLKVPNRRWSKFRYNMGGHGPKGKVKCGTYTSNNIFQMTEKVLQQSNDCDHKQGEMKTTQA